MPIMTNRPGIPTSSATHVSTARTHMHITNKFEDIYLTYRVLEYLAWGPAHSVHHPSGSYTTVFEPNPTVQRVSSNTTQVQFLTTTALLYSPPYPHQQVTITTNMTDINSTSKYFAFSATALCEWYYGRCEIVHPGKQPVVRRHGMGQNNQL
jgi:hypothetical protein